ncbi:MaoC family dehydratase [Azospirillum canadense]|uniref:MaoC family dehydratase n=1 Tax=Azospirillum canadense TaxID=403962 RepID=UPI0022268182|nr:MaoC family dehydratase [Azospirillum canadense]MCW2242365.1 acyl dehydratase [Azospirillum canadense]
MDNWPVADWQSLPELSSLKTGPHLREPTYDGIVVPEETPAVRYVADDAAIKAYCYAVDCQDPWYFGPTSPFGKRIAPSAMVLKELMWLYQTQYNRDRIRGFHQHEDVIFHAPIPAGAELVLTGRNTEKFTKRGKGYFRHLSEARGCDGRLYVSQVNTELIDLSRSGIPDDPDPRQSRRLSTVWMGDAPVSVGLSPPPKGGMRLPEGTMTVDRAQASVFSGLIDGFVNLHTDRGVAAEMGFPDLVVQGLMSVCWLSETLTRWAGPVWLSGGSMSASFLKPMLAGRMTTVRTMVAQAKDGAVDLETSFVNAAGETQAVAFSRLRTG